MNGADWAGVILGGIGTVTGIVGLYFARQSAKSSEVSAEASKISAQAARESTDVQIAAWNEQKRAELVWVDLQHRWEVDTDDENRGRFTIGLRNEGRAPAYSTSVGLYFHQSNRYTYSSNSFAAFDDVEMKYRYEYTSEVIMPGTTHLFREWAYRKDMGDGTKRHMTIRVSYRDGLGNHRLDVKLWLGGQWKAEGFTFTHVSDCLDGQLTLIGVEELPEFMRVGGEYDLPCPSP